MSSMWTEGRQAGRRTDRLMTKLIIVFRNFENAPKNKHNISTNKCTIYCYICLVYGILPLYVAIFREEWTKICYNYISVRTIPPLISLINAQSMEHTKEPINLRWIPKCFIPLSPVTSEWREDPIFILITRPTLGLMQTRNSGIGKHDNVWSLVSSYHNIWHP
jgi:hypothetical protein